MRVILMALFLFAFILSGIGLSILSFFVPIDYHGSTFFMFAFSTLGCLILK